MGYVKQEPHPVTKVIPHATERRGALHPETGCRPLACLSMGHCGTCLSRVVLDKLGRYRHVEAR